MTVNYSLVAQEAEKAAVEAREIAEITALELTPDEASEALTEVQTKIRALEQRRVAITKPLLEAKRQVDLLFDPALDALGRTKTLLKDIIAKAVKESRAEQEKALAAGDVQTALAVPTVQAATRAETRFRVVDPNKVPRRFLVVDERAVYAAIRAGETVPGVETWTEHVVIARGRR